jgi:hypothetical protein
MALVSHAGTIRSEFGFPARIGAAGENGENFRRSFSAAA